MRQWFTILAALVLCALSTGAASAQSPLSCGTAPTSVCEDQDLAGLESERTALIAQLSAADPANAALANEQTWVDGLGACGEDVECYRTAYLNHNQSLRQASGAMPGGVPTEVPLETPADAPPTVDEQVAIDEVQEERLRDAAEEARNNTPPRRGDAVYVPAGLPGWGFFTMIGVTFFVFWLIMRALKRHRLELRAEEAQMRARYR
jgi:uncharacterized protein